MANLTQKGKIALVVFLFSISGLVVFVAAWQILEGIDEIYFSGASPSSQSGALSPAQRHEVEVMIYEACVDNYNQTRQPGDFIGVMRACGQRPYEE